MSEEAKELWCTTHGAHHWTDLSDPDCEFEEE